MVGSLSGGGGGWNERRGFGVVPADEGIQTFRIEKERRVFGPKSQDREIEVSKLAMALILGVFRRKHVGVLERWSLVVKERISK